MRADTHELYEVPIAQAVLRAKASPKTGAEKKDVLPLVLKHATDHDLHLSSEPIG
ncbi:hypothetical protein NXT3_PC00200 (plasmid) [Sinorhizobium fredii]|uniref:Uncharacterized protein n=1 Tax=Rhizobium fredii TaxID=380 RepID=A0A2L0HD37_RHIFR|nr:hypothetical protein NXT3_PC00200 [Sinorhizobium fredii]